MRSEGERRLGGWGGGGGGWGCWGEVVVGGVADGGDEHLIGLTVTGQVERRR